MPSARFANLITTEAGEEVLVYDSASHHIHHLNATSAAVWRECDGRRSLAGVATAAGVTQETARLAVTRLANAGLLENPLPADLRTAGHSRRSFMKKAAVAGAVPVIVSVTAPTAAQATSVVCGQSCVVDADCGSRGGGCGQCIDNVCANPGGGGGGGD